MPGFEPINRPVRKNANGGFDILLGKALTGDAITGPAISADAAAPPDMTGDPDLQEDRATREVGGPGAGWVDQIGQTTGTNDSRAQYTPPSMPPDMGGNGMLSRLMPGGMGDTLASVAGGMNTIDRNQSPLAGFAAGFSGAMDTRNTRRKDKRAEMLELEDRQLRREELKYQHGRDEFRDRFLMSAEERAAAAEGREGKRFQMDEAQAAQRAKVTDAELRKVNIELDRLVNQKGLTTDQAIKVRDQVASSAGKAFEGADFTDEKVREAFTQVISDEYNKAIQTITGGAAATPTTGPDGLPVAAATAPASAGDGKTAATALKWTAGTAPKTDDEFLAAAEAAVAANGGNPIYIVNPGNPAAGPQLYVSKRAG